MVDPSNNSQEFCLNVTSQKSLFDVKKPSIAVLTKFYSVKRLVFCDCAKMFQIAPIVKTVLNLYL